MPFHVGESVPTWIAMLVNIGVFNVLGSQAVVARFAGCHLLVLGECDLDQSTSRSMMSALEDVYVISD
jgi:hypothetical protein